MTADEPHWSRAIVGDGRDDGVFLTGATGFLGMELLVRYLQRTERNVFVLVRAVREREAAVRVRHTLLSLFGAGHPYARRVIPVRGDVTRSELGFGDRRAWVAEHVNEVVHCAASVSFELGLGASRATNVRGTRRVLEFAKHCATHGGLRRFSHVSTAFVAGEHAGCFSEDDLDVGQRFRNAYEQSKCEAELLVRRWGARLPITVLRPSIVVGERNSGWTTSFNGLYWPLRAFSRGAYTVLPARGPAPVDVVPVDYVADAIFALADSPEAEGATFHLTAGEHTSSVGELASLASRSFDRPAPRLIEPLVYRYAVRPLLVRAAGEERLRRTLKRSDIFFPYFSTRVRFDNRRARVALRPTGIAMTPLPDYFERLVEFALAADWGWRPIPRVTSRGTVEPLARRRARKRPAPRSSPEAPIQPVSA